MRCTRVGWHGAPAEAEHANGSPGRGTPHPVLAQPHGGRRNPNGVQPLAVAEASYAALHVSGLTTEQQRELDEAIALIRHIPASGETPSLDTS